MKSGGKGLGEVKRVVDLSGRSVIVLVDIYYMLGGAYLSSLFPYRRGLIYLAAVIFVYMVMRRYGWEQYSRREVCGWLLCLGIGLLCTYVTGEFTLVITGICMWAYMNVDKSVLFQNLLLEKGGFLAVSAVCAVAGVISTKSGSYERLYNFFGDGIVYRRSLGFRNYNVLGLMVFELMVLYVLFVNEKYKRRLKAREYIFLTGTLILSYTVSGSRTALIGGIVLLAALAFSDLGWLRLRVLKAMITAVLIGGCCIFSFGIVLLHDQSPMLYQKLDNILQARLRFVYRYMLKFGIRIFGNNTKDLTGFWGDEVGFHWISLDCGYAAMMIKYGLIVTSLAVFLHIMYCYGRQCAVERYVLCVMLAAGIYNISENILLFPTMNFSLLYLADVISGNRIRGPGEGKARLSCPADGGSPAEQESSG